MRKILRDPTSFAAYDLKVGGVRRKILIIGEIHDITDCHRADHHVSLADFIQEYHQNIGTGKVLDIYSESFYVGGKKLGWVPTLRTLLHRTATMDDARALSYIRKRLDACSPKFNFSFYDCPENVRVHLCDIRFSREMTPATTKSPDDCAVAKLFRVGLSYINQDKIPRTVFALRRLLAFVRGFLFEDNTLILDHVFKTTKIMKQVENIRSPDARRKLTSWSAGMLDESLQNARSKWERFDKDHGRVLADQPAFAQASESCFNSFVRNISMPVLYVISVFMDTYLTARLLRHFSDGTHAKDAIVYVGEYHAKNYRNLMRLLGAKRVYYKTSMRADGSYASCVDITQFYKSQMKNYISIQKKQ